MTDGAQHPQFLIPRHGLVPADPALVAAHELSRREMLALLSGIMLSLSGCGGDSPTGPDSPLPPPAGLHPAHGIVMLPDGSTLSLATLTLRTMGQAIPLGAGASFDASISPSAPTMALVTDANGNGIMAGFLDPVIGGAQPVTARSTGVVLTWFAMGGPFLPANLKSQVLALLSADPSMDTLGAVIGQRIAADPLAVASGDTQIASALSTALNGFAQSAFRSPDLMNHAPAVDMATTTPDTPPQFSISPPTDQGGVSVGRDPNIIGVDLGNYFRRPVKAYVYEVQKSSAGVTSDLVPAKLVAGPFDLGEPVSVTPLGGFKQFLALANPYKSFTIDPIPLALDGAADSTTYEVVVIGPSATGVTPAFFAAPRYSTHVGGWVTAINAMFARTYYADLVYATLLEITGFGSVLPTSPNLVAAGANTKKFAGIPFTSTATQAAPPTESTLRLAMNGTLTNDVLRSDYVEQYHAIAPTIMDKVEALALQQINKVDWAASLKSGVNFVNKLGSPFANYQSSHAISKLFDNLAHADQGLLWTVVLSKANVTITPASPTVERGETVALTLVLSSDLVSSYEFDWSESSSTAHLSAVGETNEGAFIKTSKTSVNLVTSPADDAPITIDVSVYDIANGKRLFVTRTNAIVNILQKAAINPASAVMLHGDHATFTVTVTGTLPSDVHYIWTVVGTSGSIGAANVVTTTSPNIVYTGVQKGTDSLQVQVVSSTNRLLARATAEINVDPPIFFQVVISGGWSSFQAGTWAFTDTLGLRTPSPIAGLDAVFLESDNHGSSTGALVTIVVPHAHVFATGDTFTKFTGGLPDAGQFQLTLTTDFNNVGSSGALAPQGTGTLRIDRMSQLLDGTFVAEYSFTITGSPSGTMTGNGVARWT